MAKKHSRPSTLRQIAVALVFITIGASVPILYQSLSNSGTSSASPPEEGPAHIVEDVVIRKEERLVVSQAADVIPTSTQQEIAEMEAKKKANKEFDDRLKKIMLPELQERAKNPADDTDRDELRDMIVKIEKNIVSFFRGDIGESCYSVCKRNGLNCGSPWYIRMNKCNILQKIFPEARSCSDLYFGRDLPAYRPSDKTALANRKPNSFYPSCGIGHELTERPCGCEPGEKPTPVTYHTVYNCQPSKYFEWQSRYSYFWFKQVEQPGKWTRLLSAARGDHLMEELPTHVSPAWDMARDPYVPYNKPMALSHWLANAKIEEDVIILIDPDCMYIRKADIPVKEGYPVANAGYYVFPDDEDSVETEICRRYCPYCKWFDPIAVPVVIHRKDAEKLAPLWLDMTIRIREDRNNWPRNYTDNSKTVNSLSWVAEMYGYVIAAAMLGLRHEIFDLQGVPSVHKNTRAPFLHYHISVEMQNFTWNKGNIDAATNYVWPVHKDMYGWDPVKELFFTKLHDAHTALGQTSFQWPAIDHRAPLS